MFDGHAMLIEVLVRQLAQHLDIDIVLGKTLSVLGHAELFFSEPRRGPLNQRTGSSSIAA
jgi:hypothetical protein